MKVLKFGGTSVGSVESIKQVKGIICSIDIDQNFPSYVICSAMSGVTDLLIQMSDLSSQGKEEYKNLFMVFCEKHLAIIQAIIPREFQEDLKLDFIKHFEDLEGILQGISLLKESSPRSRDYVVSFGERLSCQLVNAYLKSQGVQSEYLDARKVIKTNNDFGSASVDFLETNKLLNSFHSACQADIVVMTGFIASNDRGVTTTLGRGGSDYTASLVSSALNVEALEIWTDVDGVLNADPRKVASAYTIPYLHYQEAMEMSHFGAKVIYPPTIQPVLKKSIPLFIKNTLNPKSKGTEIGNDERKTKSAIKGISSINQISLINLKGSALYGSPGSASRLFSCLANESINIIMITQSSSEQSITFAVKDDDAKTAIDCIAKEFLTEINNGTVEAPVAESDLCIVAMVGLGMRNMQGIAGKLFGVLGKNGVNIKAIAQGSSELNISFVISKKDELKALNLIHEDFFLSELKQTNIFIVGVGLIGGTLINQILENQERLKKTKSLHIQVAGICRSSRMITNKKGIDLNSWQEQLEAGEKLDSLDQYIDKIIEMNLRNAVLIDCTASEEVPSNYEKVLNANISISTPNKLACSSSYANYSKLKELAEARQIHLKYETNVGAGLPIITTIESLLNSGDEIQSIEGVLSGSCSYIFNSLDSNTTFYEVVNDAKARGLTEPDPRDDLSGKDIQRKITILAREAGFALETNAVEMQSILPDSSLKQDTVEDFMNSLIEKEDYFHQMVKKAEQNQSRLRFIAKYADGKASIKLKEVGSDNPFYNLQGSDNMVVIKTNRYHERPLVVSGPGAGAEVTSAGIFSEIIAML